MSATMVSTCEHDRHAAIVPTTGSGNHGRVAVRSIVKIELPAPYVAGPTRRADHAAMASILSVPPLSRNSEMPTAEQISCEVRQPHELRP